MPWKWILPFALTLLLHAGEEVRVVDGVKYRIVTAEPARVRIVWRDARGVPLRTFTAARDFLTTRGEAAGTLVNGGIFEPGGIPSGLMVQDGMELRPLNLAEGRGNFFLKPNGIFLIQGTKASIIAAEDWPRMGAKATFAVQSGPLLLHRGRIHPAFRAASENRLIRNGVGVDSKGRVILAITDFHSPALPNLHGFASLFLKLGCADALFLDGDISQMKSGAAIDGEGNRFGSIIAVTENR